MPELAEVETVRNVLKKSILNKRIKKVKVLYEKMIKSDLSSFKEILTNNQFIDIKRRGKYLIFELENHYLISHLRMEGKYFIKPMDEKIDKHEHVIIYFEDFTLRYHDTRKFGIMEIIEKDKLDKYFSNVGPDANLNVDFNYLKEKLNRKVPIKSLLLDQSIIAGLGNIYVDEVLFQSKILPTRVGTSLTDDEIKGIIASSKVILDNAIKYKGTTIRSYTSSLGVTGSYQDYLKVHTKKKCLCGNIIETTKVGGRTSYFCKNCQK